jgi:nucleoside-diphosphate-sugar epimerase
VARYLITGGAGFIGSHLAEALIARGDGVHVLDDLSTGSMANIEHLRPARGFEYTIDSAANERLVAELVDAADIVYHLAAAVGVELIVESPVRTIETNVHCTEIILAEAARRRRPVFVASTSEVYGKGERLPFREDGDLLMGPTSVGRWAYACSKALDEFLAIAYWHERRLPTVVARLFNTVGPRQTGRYGMVIPRFVRHALAGQPVTIHGDGTQRRCFVHVADAVDALIALMEGQQLFGEVFNVGSTEETTITALAERVRVRTNSSSPMVLVPYDLAHGPGFEDITRRVPDLTKIERAIGWVPRRSLDQILDDVIDHQRRTGES